VLVSASVVATTTTSASTRVTIRQVEMLSRGHLGVRRRYGDDVRLDSRCAKTGGNGVTCLSRRPSSLPRRCLPRLALHKERREMVSRARLGVSRHYRDDVRLDSRYAKTGGKWCQVLVSTSVVATATTSASTRVTLRQGGNGVTCLSRRPSSLPRRRPPRLALR